MIVMVLPDDGMSIILIYSYLWWSGTLPEPDFFLGLPESDFSGRVCTRTRPNEPKQKICSKECMIPDKIPDFLEFLPESDLLLSDLFGTQLFATFSTTLFRTNSQCYKLNLLFSF